MTTTTKPKRAETTEQRLQRTLSDPVRKTEIAGRYDVSDLKDLTPEQAAEIISEMEAR